MRAKDDGFARARRALHQVDAEVDLARLRAVTAQHDRSDTDLLPPDESDVFGVEILRTGQRPAHPRRRTAVWALAATVALLCGAGVGIATLWPEPGGTPPGSQVSPSPAPRPSREPAPDNSTATDPRECTTPAPIPSPAPGRTAQAPPSDDCSPSPTPSTPTDQART
jgi:hypothetical protein